MSNKTRPGDVDKAKEILFKTLDDATETKEVFIIKYNGKRFKSKSGKIAWDTIKAAKLAIRYTVQNYVYTQGFDSNEVIKQLEENGVITYEKIEEVNGTFK